MTAGKNSELEALTGDVTLIPLKTYVEKDGTYVNYKGIRQVANKGVAILPNALSIIEVVEALTGEPVLSEIAANMIGVGRIHNEFTLSRGNL